LAFWVLAACCKRFVLMSVEGLPLVPTPERVPSPVLLVREWWGCEVLFWVQPFLKIKVSVPGRMIPRKATAVARAFGVIP
jgi:hypothetical protein